jgi:hypothetical protein
VVRGLHPFLGRRAPQPARGRPNKWIGDFKGKFEHKFYPCLFEFVKEGRVKNPALVLAPVARRMSHVFDEQEWIAEDEDDDEEEQRRARRWR